MAQITINGGQTFPEGTSVTVYPTSAWPTESLSGAPTGSAAAGPVTITNGQATFTGLAEGTDYVAYANVSGQDKYRRFTTRTDVGSASWTTRGPWNSGTAYERGDVTTYLGGSYVAVTHVNTGGQSPAVDTTNWAQIANGGGLIAGPAQITSNFVFALTAASLQDVTGMSLVVPAGSPACEVVAKAPMIQFVFAAGATVGQQATLRLFLVDEGNVTLGHSIVRVTAAVAGASTHWQQSQVAADLAAITVAKTVKLSGWLDTITNLTSCTLWAGAGTGTPPSTATLGPVKMDAKAR